MNATSSVDAIVIDDNNESADLMAMIISLHDHSALAYYTGIDGVQAIRQLRPRLVVTDMRMHGMSGFDVLDAVRRIDGAYHPIVVSMTAWMEPPAHRSDKSEKFDLEFAKPVSQEAIKKMLALLEPKSP